ncbi:cuticle protein CP14.6-like [Uranotaenia lowii]|uniref:cuticle protein CP14.6-like n=1 Tax=Uranotaenia lowii TaxID=190385 RepID=UPI0024788F16|nr:cuticle protein CP14.6-like [Uranotaenia lowii]
MSKITLISVLSMVVAVLAAPQIPPQNNGGDNSGIQLLRYNFTNNNEAGYAFTYEQSNKQIFSEVGTPKDTANGTKILGVEGAFTFVSPDGQTYWVNYKADENGFLPKTGTGTTGGIQPGQDAPVRT